MSLKSFDKFCENLILAEPSSENRDAVFDERQKIIRSQLAIETMIICIAAIFINCIAMELICRWAEHQFVTIILIVMLSIFYWLIRCAAKGCWVAVVNKQTQKGGSIMMIFIYALNLIRSFFTIIEEGIFSANGTLSDEFIFTLTFIQGIICGIFSLCVIRRADKTNESEESK